MDKKSKKTSVYKRLFFYVSNIILVLLFLVALFILISLLPFKNNFKLFAVLSGSMEPTIKTGSLVIIKPVSIYEVGDIISFHPLNAKTAGETTTHRIYKIENKNGNDAYITKGDANKVSDSESISKDRIIGKKILSIVLIGYLLGYIKTLPGLILIIIIPATIIIYEEINKIKREAKQIIIKRRERKSLANKVNIKKKDGGNAKAS